MKNTLFFVEFSKIIKQRSILLHPFYKCWQAGKLKKEELQEYTKQYYHFENSFPRFMSGIHANSDNAKMRQVMLKDLINEEGETTNHVNQLVTFSEALGLSKKEVVNSKQNKNTKEAIDTILGLTQDKDINKGLAALAAYKEQIAKVATTKEHGLKEFYGIKHDDDIQFFKTHAKRNTAWRKLLDKNIRESEYPVALNATVLLCNAWWHYLDGVTTPSIIERMAY